VVPPLSMMIVFVTDESADRDFRRRRSRFQAVHHQLRTASNFWRLAPTCAAPIKATEVSRDFVPP
jgi:hypothetical protein